MASSKIALGICIVLFGFICGRIASADPLNPEQIKLISDTAASICNTIKDAKGQKTNLQIEGDVRVQLSGVLGKIADLGGGAKGSLSKEEFEGLSRDATATGLEGDRGCRERVFDKMWERIATAGSGPTATQDIAQQLIGRYQVVLGPKGGCNGGAPYSYPNNPARITSDGVNLIAFNECGARTLVQIHPAGRQIFFYNERADLDLSNGLLIRAEDGNSWLKIP